MKKLLILFLLFSLCLPTQASASECMNLHLAYQKEKVGKEAREKSPKQHTRKIWKLWAFLWIALLLGAVVGLIGWLLVRHGIVWWLLGGGIAGFLIVGLIYILVDKFGVFFKLKF